MKIRFALLLSVALAFAHSVPAIAQTTRLNVGYSAASADQRPAWVAKEAGLFKENGLDVQLIFIGSSSS